MTDEEKESVFKLLTKEQWVLLGICFDSVSFKSGQLEDAVVVKKVLIEILSQ